MPRGGLRSVRGLSGGEATIEEGRNEIIPDVAGARSDDRNAESGEDSESCRQSPAGTPSSSRLRNARVLLTCIFFQFVSTGFAFSLGVIYVELLPAFGTSRSEASLLVSLCLGVTYGMGAVVGVAVKKCGLRLTFFLGGFISGCAFLGAAFVNSMTSLIILIGVLAGSGFSLVNVGSYVGATECFKSKRNLCLSFVSAGSTLGAAVLPFLMNWFIRLYGWRGNFLLASGIIFQICAMAFSFGSGGGVKPQASHPGENKVKLLDILKNKVLWAFLFSTMNYGMGFTIISIILVDHGINVGYTLEASTLLITVYSICNASGRILFGVLNVFWKNCGMAAYCTASLTAGIFLFLLPFVEHYPGVLAVAAIIGLNVGGSVAMSLVALLKLVGLPAYPVAYGLMATAIGVGNAVGGPIAGVIADVTGNYKLSFVAAGGIVVSAISLLIWMLLLDSCCAHVKSLAKKNGPAQIPYTVSFINIQPPNAILLISVNKHLIKRFLEKRETDRQMALLLD